MRILLRSTPHSTHETSYANSLTLYDYRYAWAFYRLGMIYWLPMTKMNVWLIKSRKLP